MKKIIIITIIVVITGFLLKDYIFNIFSSESNSVNIGVVVANEYIESGKVIKTNMIKLNYIPKKYIQPGVVRNKKEVIGKIAIAPISVNEQILANKIAVQGSSLSYSLPIGRRAITIAVDDISGVGGFIKPGDFIDVIVTVDVIEKNTTKSYSVTLLQNIKVIAINEKEESNGYVTLEVSPENAEVLSFAEDKGKIKLVLRSHLDNNIVALKSVKFSNLIKKMPKKRIKHKKKPQVISGMEND